MVEQLKQIKSTLIGQVQSQMGDLKKVNTHELGEVIDMVKDLEEALYYCSITEAMEKRSEDENEPQIVNYYTTPYYIHDRDMDRSYGRSYYTDSQSNGNSSSSGNNNSSSSNSRSYTPYIEEYNARDSREGSSPMYRKMYMETKEMNKDHKMAMKDLEEYMGSLSNDITDMIKNSSPEEKQMLQSKLMQLATKIK